MKALGGTVVVVLDDVTDGSDDPPPGSVRRPVVVTSSDGGVVDPVPGETDVSQAEIRMATTAMHAVYRNRIFRM